MNVNEAGIAMIKEREGYKKALPDGRCTTYYCPAGKLTIGWGCTEGIKPNDIWTREQAEAGLQRELRKHEAAVMRLVSVPLNENQLSALVSFSYNVGYGPTGLGGSTLLRKLNKGDYVGAQAEFMRWNKATVDGRKVVLRGLSIRRAKEAALFAERTAEEDAEKGELEMVQAVDAPKEPVSAGTKGAIIGTTGVGAVEVGKAIVSAPPPAVADTVSNVGAWQSIGKTAVSLSQALWASPVLTGVIACVAVAALWGPDLWRKVNGS